jgi:hypothetical protein
MYDADTTGDMGPGPNNGGGGYAPGGPGGNMGGGPMGGGNMAGAESNGPSGQHGSFYRLAGAQSNGPSGQHGSFYHLARGPMGGGMMGGGMMGGGMMGGGMIGGGMMGGGMGLGGQTPGMEAGPYDAVVELSGIIYLYNPPDLAKLGTGSSKDPATRSFSVPKAKVTAHGASKGSGMMNYTSPSQ